MKRDAFFAGSQRERIVVALEKVWKMPSLYGLALALVVRREVALYRKLSCGRRRLRNRIGNYRPCLGMISFCYGHASVFH